MNDTQTVIVRNFKWGMDSQLAVLEVTMTLECARNETLESWMPVKVVDIDEIVLWLGGSKVGFTLEENGSLPYGRYMSTWTDWLVKLASRSEEIQHAISVSAEYVIESHDEDEEEG